MKRLLWPVAVVGLLGLLAPSAIAGAFDCVPTGADPRTVNAVEIDGRLFYVEERAVPGAGDIPVPGTGAAFGEGTWVYEETNGLAGLQRGTISLICLDLPPPPLPTLSPGCDPIMDESCGAGPDALIFALAPDLSR